MLLQIIPSMWQKKMFHTRDLICARFTLVLEK